MKTSKMEYKKASWVDHVGGQWHSSHLNPCPRCKSEAMVRMRAGGYCYIRCTNEYCQLETSEYWHGSTLKQEKMAEQDAIKAWNDMSCVQP